MELHLPPDPEALVVVKSVCLFWGGGSGGGSERDLMNASSGPQRRECAPLLSCLLPFSSSSSSSLSSPSCVTDGEMKASSGGQTSSLFTSNPAAESLQMEGIFHAALQRHTHTQLLVFSIFFFFPTTLLPQDAAVCGRRPLTVINTTGCPSTTDI